MRITRRRPAPPAAHDVLVATTWGGTTFRCASRADALVKAREVRRADRGLVTRVRVVPAG